MPATNTNAKVRFFFDEVKIHLPQRTTLKSFIELIFKKEKKQLSSINYIFCSDNRLLEINKAYLQHHYFTDIITFDLSESKTAATEAEVYISVDRVRENAREHDESIQTELLRVIFHGALHLCGYRDKTKKEQEQMRKKENDYLALYKQHQSK